MKTWVTVLVTVATTALIAFIAFAIVTLTKDDDTTKDDTATDDESNSEPEAFTVAGHMDLHSYDGIFITGSKAGSACTGDDGYQDMQAGAQVVIRDSSGEQIGLGQLAEGTLPENFREAYTCRFEFAVEDVPDMGDSLYTVEVASRGEITFKRDQADALVLTLG